MTGVAPTCIAYAPLADPEQMKKAAKVARADEFIKNLPHGYDTIIGDQGIKLSGGQPGAGGPRHRDREKYFNTMRMTGTRMISFKGMYN